MKFFDFFFNCQSFYLIRPIASIFAGLYIHSYDKFWFIDTVCNMQFEKTVSFKFMTHFKTIGQRKAYIFSSKSFINIHCSYT